MDLTGAGARAGTGPQARGQWATMVSQCGRWRRRRSSSTSHAADTSRRRSSAAEAARCPLLLPPRPRRPRPRNPRAAGGLRSLRIRPRSTRAPKTDGRSTPRTPAGYRGRFKDGRCNATVSTGEQLCGGATVPAECASGRRRAVANRDMTRSPPGSCQQKWGGRENVLSL
jgi:hypothetical protein